MESRFSEEQKRFGDRIVHLRKHVYGLKQEELAALCNMQRAEISKIENGRKNFEFLTLVKLANGFGLELRSLFDYENDFPLEKRRRGDIHRRAAAERLRFGNRIATLRKEQGKPQLDLEVESNLWDSEISRIENAKLNMKFHSVFRIAGGLKVRIVDLFIE